MDKGPEKYLSVGLRPSDENSRITLVKEKRSGIEKATLEASSEIGVAIDFKGIGFGINYSHDKYKK